jgi:hypothetical protein
VVEHRAGLGLGRQGFHLRRGLGQSLGLALDLAHVVLQDLLLRLTGKALAADPDQVLVRPARRTGPLAIVSEQERAELLARPALGEDCVLPGPQHVAQRLDFFVGRHDADQLPGAQEASQLERVAPVGLDPIAAPQRRLGGRRDQAGDPRRLEGTVEAIAVGPAS